MRFWSPHVVGEGPLGAGRRHEVQRLLLLLTEDRSLLPAARLRPKHSFY